MLLSLFAPKKASQGKMEDGEKKKQVRDLHVKAKSEISFEDAFVYILVGHKKKTTFCGKPVNGATRQSNQVSQNHIPPAPCQQVKRSWQELGLSQSWQAGQDFSGEGRSRRGHNPATFQPFSFVGCLSPSPRICCRCHSGCCYCYCCCCCCCYCCCCWSL